MPSEYRLIQFKPSEVEEAIARWMRAQGLFSQYGKIETVDLAEKKKQIRAMACHYELDGRKRKNEKVTWFDHDEFSRIMIMYCKDRGIPLALKGKKIIRLLDDKVVLYYALS